MGGEQCAQAGDSAHTLMCLQPKGGPGARYVFYYALLSPYNISSLLHLDPFYSGWKCKCE